MEEILEEDLEEMRRTVMLGRTAPLPSWVFSLAIRSCNNPGWKPHFSASDTNLKEAINCGVGDVGVAPEHLRLHH